MSSKKTCRRLFVWITILLLASCGRVKINDSEFCGDMGSEGATCFNLLSDKKREIKKEQWDEERFGMICSDSEAFLNLKTAIQKLCYVSKRCYYDNAKKIIKFEENIIDFEKIIKTESKNETNRYDREHVGGGHQR
jgi:hypothetical protein